MSRLLILDDDKLFCEALGSTLEAEGYSVLVAHSLARARELLKKQQIAVFFIDVYLPDGNGLDLLPGLSLLPEPPEAIVITAKGDPQGAEDAITAGAWDYIQKPANLPQIVLMVRRALEARERRLRMPKLSGESGIVGNSGPMRATLLQMFEAAQSDAPALISGETGTGKELMARAVHKNSRRAKGPFVVVDCGAITPTLLESELFGNIRGAFTGAVHSRHGLAMLADGGTLFLDEVGELALEQQKVFLRLLQERRFRPIGGKDEVSSDFRVVAATNRNLAEMAAGGTFRSDLLFRLQGVVVEVPPVRLRGDDISLLAHFALQRTVSHYGLKEKDFSEDALNALAAYSWPGNVREMLHAVEAAALAAQESDLVLLQHLPVHLRAHAARSRVQGREAALGPDAAAILQGAGRVHTEGAAAAAPLQAVLGPAAPVPAFSAPAGSDPVVLDPAASRPATEGGSPGTWKELQQGDLYQCKRRYLLDLLHCCKGSVSEAARMAGVSRQRLYVLLKEHSIARQWEG